MNIRLLARCIVRRRVPGQLVVQITDRCNASCPQCGMRATERFPRSTLPADTIRRLIDEAAAHGVRAISFTGGEPLLYLDTVVELIRYAGRAGIRYIRTGTNAFSLRPGGRDFDGRIRQLAEKLASTPLRNFWISLDSALPGVHEEMRGFPGVVEGIERAVPVFHEHGLFPSVNLGINRRVGGESTELLRGSDRASLDRTYEAYRSAFRAFYRRSLDLGFTIVNSCYPMSVTEEESSLEAVYEASSAGDIVRYTAAEKAEVFRALLDTIPEFRSSIRIFTPRVALRELCRRYSGAAPDAGPDAGYACLGGKDFFFVDARDGHVYPCGYRGHEKLGASFAEAMAAASAARDDCRECDWECFRDPSELFGPLLHLISSPLGFWRRTRREPGYLRLLRDDLSYYRACDFFDGRRPPRPSRLQRFARPDAPADPQAVMAETTA